MLLLIHLLLGEVVETVTGVLLKNYYKKTKMKYGLSLAEEINTQKLVMIKYIYMHTH